MTIPPFFLIIQRRTATVNGKYMNNPQIMVPVSRAMLKTDAKEAPERTRCLLHLFIRLAHVAVVAARILVYRFQARCSSSQCRHAAARRV